MSPRTLPLITALLLAGCQTNISPLRVIDLARSGDPKAALEGMARTRAQHYVTHPGELPGDLGEFFAAVSRLADKVRGVWGGGEVESPSAKRYVKYTNNYLSRAIVDFDKGTVVVETLDTKAPEESLRNAIVTTLLTPDDPRAVDMYSAQEIKLSGTPYLAGEVLDHEGKAIIYPWRATRFADWLTANRSRQRTVEGGKVARYVEIPMVADHMEVRARKYAPLVEKYADRWKVSRNLVYSIIKTESDFNPFAVSSAPAFGLMQIVPTTAGRDAYRHVHGRDTTPTKAYLFDAEQNIELGTAYLNKLQYDYLEPVADPTAREYCTIAAYNGGIGTVMNGFSSNRKRAPAVINSLPPGDVYQRLQARMPEETRNYLIKVLKYKKGFVGS